MIRLIKRAFQNAGISLPDESREIIFPQGVAIRRVDKRVGTGSVQTATRLPAETEAVTPDGGEKLLQNNAPAMTKPA